MSNELKKAISDLFSNPSKIEANPAIQESAAAKAMLRQLNKSRKPLETFNTYDMEAYKNDIKELLRKNERTIAEDIILYNALSEADRKRFNASLPRSVRRSLAKAAKKAAPIVETTGYAVNQISSVTAKSMINGGIDHFKTSIGRWNGRNDQVKFAKLPPEEQQKIIEKRKKGPSWVEKKIRSGVRVDRIIKTWKAITFLPKLTLSATEVFAGATIFSAGVSLEAARIAGLFTAAAAGLGYKGTSYVMPKIIKNGKKLLNAAPSNEEIKEFMMIINQRGRLKTNSNHSDYHDTESWIKKHARINKIITTDNNDEINEAIKTVLTKEGKINKSAVALLSMNPKINAKQSKVLALAIKELASEDSSAYVFLKQLTETNHSNSKNMNSIEPEVEEILNTRPEIAKQMLGDIALNGENSTFRKYAVQAAIKVGTDFPLSMIEGDFTESELFQYMESLPSDKKIYVLGRALANNKNLSKDTLTRFYADPDYRELQTMIEFNHNAQNSDLLAEAINDELSKESPSIDNLIRYLETKRKSDFAIKQGELIFNKLSPALKGGFIASFKKHILNRNSDFSKAITGRIRSDKEASSSSKFKTSILKYAANNMKKEMAENSKNSPQDGVIGGHHSNNEISFSINLTVHARGKGICFIPAAVAEADIESYLADNFNDNWLTESSADLDPLPSDCVQVSEVRFDRNLKMEDFEIIEAAESIEGDNKIRFNISKGLADIEFSKRYPLQGDNDDELNQYLDLFFSDYGETLIELATGQTVKCHVSLNGEEADCEYTVYGEKIV
jgi:hypothetical protein